MRRLEGKVLIVTGGNSGIGEAASLLFAQEGAAVIVAARRRDEGQAVVTRIRDTGGRATFIPVDVSVKSDCEAMVSCAVENYGRLDGAFNNAGYSPVGPLLAETPDDEFEQAIAVNVRGTFFCMRAEIPAILASGGGAIVNTASAAGLVGFATMAVYTGSKHDVVGLTRGAALDYARQNIRINAICPGGTKTPMFGRAEDPRLVEAYTNMHPMGRLCEPIEQARAALFLLSDDASFITGQALAVDGGLTVP